MAIVDELIAVLGYELHGEANVKKFTNQIEGVADQVKRMTARITMYGAAADKAFGASRSMAIPSALALLAGKRIKDAALTTEGWAQAFTTVTGSAESANDEIEKAAMLADRYGANVEAVTDNWVKLKAATKGTEIAPDIQEIFQTFTAVSVKLGQGKDQLDGALKAVEQMVSKGKVQAEELRGQLGERVYGAFIKAADSMGITTAQLDKMLEQGQVVASDLLPKLAKQLQKDYNLDLGDRIESDIATFARLNNSLFKLRVSIARSGFIDFLADAAAGATKLVNMVAEAPPWVQKLISTMIVLVAVSAPLLWIFGAIARSISVILKAVLAIRTMGTAIAAMAGVTSSGGLIPFFASLRVVLASVALMALPILKVVAIVAALGLGLEDLWHFMQGGESLIGRFIEWFQAANFSQIGENIGTGIVDGVATFVKNLEGFVDKAVPAIVEILTNPEFYKAGAEIGWSILAGLVAVGRALAKAVFDLIVGIFFGIIDQIAGFDVREAGLALARNIFASIAEAWAAKKEQAMGVFYSLVNWLAEIPLFQAGVDMINRLFEGMKSIGGKIKDWFAGLVPDWAKDFVGMDSSSEATPDEMAQNLTGNLARTNSEPGFSAGQISNNSNRSNQSVTNSINIEQKVSQPTNAPDKLAQATGKALANVMPGRAQLQGEPVL